MEPRRDPLVGRTLESRYRVDERIARGGMATVYRGTDLKLHRDVAIKVMHPSLSADPKFVDRFNTEARTAAGLSHPNIVSVFDQGEDENILFLVMEFVPGQSLRDLLDDEFKLSTTEALGVTQAILSGLAAAHGKGMIHRDIKPANVLISDDGHVKVADFGLARAVGSTGNTSTSGVLIGTAAYLAPEVILNHEITPGTDVYATGVVLYEMLTGSKPHQADSAIQVAYKHVNEDVPNPSALEPLPDYIDQLVRRATAREPQNRFLDASDFGHDVTKARRQLLNHPITTSPANPRQVDQTVAMPTSPASNPAEIELSQPTNELETGMDSTSAITLPPGLINKPATAQPQTTSPVTSSPIKIKPAPKQTGGLIKKLPTPGTIKINRPKQSRTALLIGLLIAGLLAAGVGWYYLVARYTQTPSLLQLNKTEALNRLQGSGLRLEISDQVYSETVRKGLIIETSPSPNSKILKDGLITAIISKGAERHQVPKLAGKTLAKATELITANKLVVGTIKRSYDENVPKGSVIVATPRAGTKLKRDTPVKLLISDGPEPIQITDYTGQSAALAIKNLQAAGFDVAVTKQFSDTVQKGKVVSQTPNSGTGFKNDNINIVISKGAELAAVPEVIGLDIGTAQKMMKAAGFKTKTIRSPVYFGLNIVVNTNPPSGTMAAKGSVITVEIN